MSSVNTVAAAVSMTSLRINHIAKTPIVLNHVLAARAVALAEEAVHLLKTSRDRVTARSLIRAALALIGEPVRHADATEESNAAGQILDDADFAEFCESIDGMIRKVKEAVREKERDSVVAYLKSIHRMLGNGVGSGSLTPRPRDYEAAMHRFADNALNSPSQLRGTTAQERLEHTHSTTHL